MCVQSWLPLKSRGLTQRVFGKKIPKDFLRDFKHFGVWPSVFSGKKNRKLDSYKILKICEIWGLTQRVFGKKIPHVGFFFPENTLGQTPEIKKIKIYWALAHDFCAVFFSWKHAGSNPGNRFFEKCPVFFSWKHAGSNPGIQVFFPDLPIGVKYPGT